MFYRRFGGAARTKNIQGERNPNGRQFFLPENAELPKDFIRQCPWEMEYVFTIAQRARIGILEIGRFNGGSAFILASAAPDIPIYSVDMAPQNDHLLAELFARTQVGSNVKLIIADSTKLNEDVGSIDMLFVDGAHDYDGCYADASVWYPRLADGGHILFHDSYLGEWGVQDAVSRFIGEHPELEVVMSPFIGPSYWNYPAGSIAHLWKRPRP